MERPLDLEVVEVFVRVTELDSFARAAEAMRTTQTAVSLKPKRIEEGLGCRLVERTPGTYSFRRGAQPSSNTQATSCDVTFTTIPALITGARTASSILGIAQENLITRRRASSKLHFVRLRTRRYT
jgi:Bacterial regulatory helix-turn-helix protein, lysR family